MDMVTLGAAIAIAKKLPDTAVGQAVAAAERSEDAALEAETSAELAGRRNFGVSVSEDVLVFERNEE